MSKRKAAARGEPMRFLRSLIENPSQSCVEWPFAIGTHGYGKVNNNGRVMDAHRAALALYLGREIKSGMLVLHKPIICHNRSCVNPTHLREGTPADNSADMGLDGTEVLGEKRHSAKLSEADVCSILKDARPQSEIAQQYGVDQSTISLIKTRRTWRHLDGGEKSA